VEQFHSKRSEQRAKKIRNLEPVVSSDDDDEMDYSEEVCHFSFCTYTFSRTHVSNH